MQRSNTKTIHREDSRRRERVHQRVGLNDNGLMKECKGQHMKGVVREMEQEITIEQTVTQREATSLGPLAHEPACMQERACGEWMG